MCCLLYSCDRGLVAVGGRLLQGEDVVVDGGIHRVPGQPLALGPVLRGGAGAVGGARVAAVGAGVLVDADAGERVADGVVPHLRVVRAGHQDAGPGPLDDVGGDHVGAGHLVEDRRGHVDELGGQDLGVDDALVEPDAGLPVGLPGRQGG